ncbi:unnamed protein product [Penicillium discolor]
MKSPYYDPGHAYQRAAPPASLPATVLGTDEVPPGAWAGHIMKAPWARAREGCWLKTDLLRLLVTKPSVREPMLRLTHLNNREPQARDITRQARANVGNIRVIQQTLVNSNEAVAEAANVSRASDDHDLLVNIAFTRGAIRENGRNIDEIEDSMEQMQTEILILLSQIRGLRQQMAALNARLS